MKRVSSMAIGVLVATAMSTASCKRPSDTTPGPLAKAAEVSSAPIEAGTPVPSGDLHGRLFHFAIAVFFTPGASKVDTDAIVRALVRDKGVVLRTELPERPIGDRLIVIRHPSIDEYAPPTAETLKYFARGLSDAERSSLPNAKAVTALLFSGPPGEAVSSYRLAVEIGATVAKATRGVVYDDETRQAFGEAAWRATLDGWEPDVPQVPNSTVIHMYQDGELLRLVTLGMSKFALPDISVNQVSSHDAPTMGTLINLVCQTLAERGVVDEVGTLAVSPGAVRNAKAKATFEKDLRPGATTKAMLHLAGAAPQEGDADNRLLEVVFPGPAGELQERQNEAVTALFGAEDDVVGVRDDAEILAASERAKHAVRKFKRRFARGAPELEQLTVKGPFQTADHGVEWMWVEVLRWEGKTIHGVLQNDPYDVPSLKAGARVDVNEDSIFDYIYRGPDGGVEGNETGDLIRARGSPRPRRD